MNPTPRMKTVALWLALGVGAGLLMISSVSLWIDEGQTYRFAREPTLASWWQTLRGNPYSEAHMPVGMLAAWAGARVFGTSEWGLRAPNLVWLGLAGVAMGLLGRRLGRPLLLPLFLLQPYLWSYVNEARPYAMQICAGAWLLHLLVHWHDTSEVRAAQAWALAAACFLGFGSSLLFGFAIFGWAFALALAWLMRRSGHEPPPSEGRAPRVPDSSRWGLPVVRRSAWLPLAFAVLVLAGLMIYFAGALQRGASAAKLWQVGAGNLGFAGYEMLGFSGLGPPRNAMRELARAPHELLRALTQPSYAAGLGGLAVAWAFVLWLLSKRRREPVALITLTFLVVTAGSLMAASLVMHFPFWGRHLAPVLPCVVLLAGLAVFPAPDEGWSGSRRVMAAWLMMVLAVSCAVVRWSPAHQRDDYRGAAALARTALARGLVVWWIGDIEQCPDYYGLLQAGREASGRLVLVPTISQGDFETLADPDVIVLSKPDIYDLAGRVGERIRLRRFERVGSLRAFSVWARPGSRAGGPPQP
jgi:hypothetical protein